MPGSGKKTESAANGGKNLPGLNFANRLITSIPHGRRGKHNLIIANILADIERLDMETAILVPLDSLNGEKMENIRSALNRATRQKKIAVSTSTDEKHFYIWRTAVKQ